MSPPRGHGSSREAILEAATRVATRDGLMAMTLDNVAREAGVSKGGVMYHFASKDLLVASMIEHFAGKVRQTLMERVAGDPNPRGRWVRAFVDLVLPEPGAAPASAATVPDLSISSLGAFYTSLLAAFALNPDLLAPVKNLGTEVRDRIIAEGDESELITWLAVDGLFLWKLFGMVKPGDALLDRIASHLRERTRPQPLPAPETPLPKKGKKR